MSLLPNVSKALPWLALLMVVSGSCSAQSQPGATSDVHRLLPTASDLGGRWKDGREDPAGPTRPVEYAPTDACRESDQGFPEHTDEGRILASREFIARNRPGLYAYVSVEQAAGGLWLAGYPEAVVDFFASPTWGRCYADSFEHKQPGRGSVTERREKPSAGVVDGGAVAWSFRLEGDPAVLRSELYVWTHGDLAFVVQVLGREQDVTDNLVNDVIDATRRKAASERP